MGGPADAGRALPLIRQAPARPLQAELRRLRVAFHPRRPTALGCQAQAMPSSVPRPSWLGLAVVPSAQGRVPGVPVPRCVARIPIALPRAALSRPWEAGGQVRHPLGTPRQSLLGRVGPRSCEGAALQPALCGGGSRWRGGPTVAIRGDPVGPLDGPRGQPLICLEVALDHVLHHVIQGELPGPAPSHWQPPGPRPRVNAVAVAVPEGPPAGMLRSPRPLLGGARALCPARALQGSLVII